jgi:hypothetical protein
MRYGKKFNKFLDKDSDIGGYGQALVLIGIAFQSTFILFDFTLILIIIN